MSDTFCEDDLRHRISATLVWYEPLGALTAAEMRGLIERVMLAIAFVDEVPT